MTASIAAVALVGTWWAAPWGDALWASAAALVTVGGGALVRARDRIDRMPLQLAPQAGTGIVDGRRVIRFRAQLGYGRTFRPTARVWSVLQDGVEAPVAVQVPDRRLCGPWTLCVDAVEGAAAYVVAMEAHEGERTWSARQRYETSQLVEGRFGHGIVGDGRLRFSADWDRVSALDGPAPE